MGFFSDLFELAGDLISIDAVDGMVSGKSDGRIGGNLGASLRRKIEDFFSDDGSYEEGENYSLGEWMSRFNSNPDADHVLFKVKCLGEEYEFDGNNGELKAIIISKSGNKIAEDCFYGPYENIRGMDGMTENFPAVDSNDDNSEDASLSEWDNWYNEYCPDDDNEWHFFDWIEDFSLEDNAYAVKFSVKHNKQEKYCNVSAKIIDEKGNILGENTCHNVPWSFYIEYLVDRTLKFVCDEDDSTESKADSPVPKIEDKTAPKQELSVEERLAKLKKLFEDGILEEDEYKEKRKELIALL